MKRLNFMIFVLIAVINTLLFLPFNSNNAFAAQEETAHGAPQEAAHGEYPGEVPFDRPVEEIKGHIAELNDQETEDRMEIFPCSDCHDEEWEVDRTRRDLDEPHDEIPGKFANHDSDNRWCLDCHSASKREQLRLLNGELIEFNEYYRVCEQCHKRVYREWKMGVHGKRTGYWNGEKQWMHCTQCHNPHDPPFKPIEPMPAPRKPLKIWSATAAGDTHSEDTHH
jgi:hypothetical protein